MHRELPKTAEDTPKDIPKLATPEDIVKYTLTQPLQFTPGQPTASLLFMLGIQYFRLDDDTCVIRNSKTH